MRWESRRLRGGVEIMFLSTVAGKGISMGQGLIYFLGE